MSARIQDGVFARRRERLARRLRSGRFGMVLVKNPLHLYYLTGFRGSAGAAVMGGPDCVLWVDPRYIVQAREEASGIEIRVEKRGLIRAAVRWLERRGMTHVGFEDTFLTWREHEQLLRLGRGTVQFVPLGDVIHELRTIKDVVEIECIRQAGRITAEVFEELLPDIRPGRRESDLAAEIEFRFRQKGAEGAAFATIVASGLRSAMPHAGATSKLLEKDDLVIFDLGAILRGYAADMTRTVFLGRPAKSVHSLFGAVMEAQMAAVSVVRAGVRAEEVDRHARHLLARRDLDRFFTHSTGHGVGLEIHERPRLAPRQRAVLKAGGVVTVEPAVYVEGTGGIRIEDTLLIRPEGSENLTPASKDNWFIS